MAACSKRAWVRLRVAGGFSETPGDFAKYTLEYIEASRWPCHGPSLRDVPQNIAFSSEPGRWSDGVLIARNSEAPAPNDKRATLVELTQQSRVPLARALADLEGGGREAMAGFSDEEQVLSRALLRRVARNLESSFERPTQIDHVRQSALRQRRGAVSSSAATGPGSATRIKSTTSTT